MTESAAPKVSRRWYKHPLVVVPSVLILSVSAIYGLVAWRYWSNPPKLTRNYAAEFNATFQDIPEDQRAWPKYRAAIVELNKVWPSQWDGDYRSVLTVPEVAEYIHSIAPSLQIAREGGSLPVLGFALADARSKDDLLWPGEKAETPSENPELLTVLIIPVQESSKLVTCLLADAFLAARSADSNRTVDDLLAVNSLAGHLLEIPCHVADLRSQRFYSQALKAWGEILSEYPTLLSDVQMRRLELAASNYASGEISIRLSGERLVMADAVQRNYTDDGRGDGYLFPTSTGSSSIEQSNRIDVIMLVPFSMFSNRYATRRELLDAYNGALDLAERETSEPLWNRTMFTYLHEVAARAKHKNKNYQLAEMMIPKLQGSYYSREQTIQQRDAMILASALVRFYRQTDNWPDSLDALVPKIIPAIPLDRFSGEVLRYKLVADRPIIYSCGPDKIDDSGMAAQIPVDPPMQSPFTFPKSTEDQPQDPTTKDWHWQFVDLPFEYLRGDWILWPPEPRVDDRKGPRKSDPGDQPRIEK